MSTLDYRDLPSDRLATTDEEGRRVWIFPARVKGVWKNRRTAFQSVLLLIFVLVPWLRWDGAPIVLLDLEHRQFVFFGESFGAHDAPILFFVFGILGFSLIIATALWGRVWCGWACPQTVFIEQVFRRIESIVVGNRATQLACHKDPFKPKHLVKIITKWTLFLVVSAFLAHTFIAYFVSWEKLLAMMSQPPAESWTVFLWMSFFTGLILFDFAWFREQFCIIMCPYGRFQAVLLDESSTTVSYDYKRGEPRHRGLKKENPSTGDCIDCYKCVSVCPTGIDIRAGQQLECIGCTACIDACDEVMEKIQRPKGLIRYASLNNIEGKKEGIGSRIYVYAFVMILFFVGFFYSLSNRNDFYVAILRQNKKVYSLVQENSQEIILNNYRMHLKNSSLKKSEFEVHIEDKQGVSMAPLELKGELEPNQSIYLPFFLKLSFEDWKNRLDKRVKILIRFKKNDQWAERYQFVKLVGPKEK